MISSLEKLILKSALSCHSSWEETTDGRTERGGGERDSIKTRIGETEAKRKE